MSKIKELQKREIEIRKLLSEVDSISWALVSELIEINIELESYNEK